jgi:hypothetical protein
VDRPLEDVLRALIGSDPHADLDDKQREAFMYALLGMISREKREAVWQFTDSITDEFMRSNLLHKLVQKTPIPSDFRLAKRLADSIPIAYWRYSSVIHIASELLKFAQACRTLNAELLGLGLDFIREAEANIPLVAEDDRSSIVWEAGLTLVRAGELDWAEKLANCSSYCPENTEVLLRVARERAAKGEKDHAIQLARKVAELAISGSDENGGRDLTNRAFDVFDVSEFVAERGEASESRQHLDAALRLAIQSDADGDIDAYKCMRAVALRLAREGDTPAAREAVNQIRLPSLRTRVLEEVSNAAAMCR